MIVKGDDGCDTKSRLHTKSLAQESIIHDDEDSIIGDIKVNASKDTKILTNDLKSYRKPTEIKTITFLKEPIPLDKLDLEGLSSVTVNVKTVQRSIIRKRPRKLKTKKHKQWMKTAEIIFEMTYVYPFIYTNNIYQCFVCLESFVEAHILKQHTMNHSFNELKYKIHKTTKKSILKIDVTDLQCRVCHNTFDSLLELKSHLKNHGKNIESDTHDNLIPFRLCDEPFLCEICGEEYYKLRSLMIHMSQHFNNFSCEVCGSAFISKPSLNSHLQTHKTGIFPCEICTKVFSSSAKKSIHVRGVHLKHLPRSCPICPEKFNSNYKRTRHLRMVHNKIAGVNKCDVCGKEYDLKYQLQLHIRSVHNQEKNEECPVCKARFFSKYLLSRHMLVHTGVRNFRCNVCGKAYVRKSHLNQHSRSHVQ